MAQAFEFEVDGKKYSAVQLPPKKQLKIAKRLLPLMEGLLTPEFIATIRQQEGKVIVDPDRVLAPMAQAFHKLDDDDIDQILALTIPTVKRQDDITKGWAVLGTADGDLAYADVKMPQLLQIVWKVIEGNLGDFFSTAP